MLTRRAKACSSSCSQIASHFIAIQPKIAKINETPYFWSSESFKVIDVDTAKKLSTKACSDRQHIHAYIQPFSWQTCRQR